MAAARVRNCFDGVTGDNDDDCTDDPWRPIFSKLRASSPAVPQPPSPHNFQDSHEKKKVESRKNKLICAFLALALSTPPNAPPPSPLIRAVSFRLICQTLYAAEKTRKA
ncbi:hypothetical protein V9T40_012131 [Parthenolecanium corni]|uniref:Uncharacterized protein n=1 Tax=Parthenolecanium corni TaxID=536013 RepID=A0AAN9T8Z2_9HEMI